MEAQNGTQAVAEPNGAVPVAGAVADGQGAASAFEGKPEADGGGAAVSQPAIPELPKDFDVTQLPAVQALQSSMDKQIQEIRKERERETAARQQQEAGYQQQLEQAARMREEYMQLQMAGMNDAERAQHMSSEYQRQNQELQQQLQQMTAQQEQQKILNEMSQLSGLAVDDIPTTSYFDATQAVLGHVSQTVQTKDEQIAALQAEVNSLKRGNQEAGSTDFGQGVPSTPTSTLQGEYNAAALAVKNGTGQTAQLAAIKDQAFKSGVQLDYMAWQRM